MVFGMPGLQPEAIARAARRLALHAPRRARRPPKA